MQRHRLHSSQGHLDERWGWASWVISALPIPIRGRSTGSALTGPKRSRLVEESYQLPYRMLRSCGRAFQAYEIRLWRITGGLEMPCQDEGLVQPCGAIAVPPL